MSLINDALKRAKQAQTTAPPPSAANLEFRPVDPPVARASSHSVMLAATLAVVLLLAILLIWQMAHNDNTPVKATQPAAPALEITASRAAAAPQKQIEPAPAAIAKERAAPEPVKPVAVATPAVDPAPAPVAAPAAAPSVQVEPPPAKPAPKLQSIVFSPTRPSAMISGKVLFVGDKFGEWRVAAIDQESATLVGAGQTNVLILP
jgi:hypothetical protein